MGLFDAPPVLAAAVAAKLVNGDERSRRELARAQPALLRELRQDELLLIIGVDRSGWAGVVVVTNERIFTVRQGRLDRRIERHRIREIKLGQQRPGRFLAIIPGSGLQPAFETLEEADRFVQTIELAMVNSRVVARDIPTLLPGLYEEILRTAGRPVSPAGVGTVAGRAAEMIAEQARLFFDRVGDQEAAERFAADFAELPDVLSAADRMIDWLWDWDPRCHQPLRRAVGILRIRLLEAH